MEYYRIIFSGLSGIGKIYLANKFVEYVIIKFGRKKIEDVIVIFNVDYKLSKVSYKFLRELLLFMYKCFK